jgi:myo-inositol-1(or 4)-monophosphatase
MKEHVSILDFLAETLDLAGKELLSRFGGKLNISTKRDASLVTDADLASEKLIIDRILRYFPDDLILSEEAGASSSNRQPGKNIWIIDPLDGTTNFSNHYPFYAVSVARGTIQANGQIFSMIAGVEDPSRKDRYLAVRGKGALWNDKPISVAEPRPFERCFLCTGFAYKVGAELSADLLGFSEISQRCQSIRRDGAAALDLALAARGVFDCFWESGLQTWDVAAGSLLVTEAGGKVVNFGHSQLDAYNIENTTIIAGNHQTVDILQGLIKNG